MAEKRKNSAYMTQRKPWSNNENLIWLASTVTLFRNIQKFKFPSKLEAAQQKQIIALISKEFLSSKTLSGPYLLNADEMDPIEKEYLVEHFLSSQSYQQAHSGEAFILDDSGQFLMALNVNNHIQLSYLDCTGELESSWNRLVKIETQLGKLINYAFSPKFGFLTADPSQSGTGLHVTVYLQPSALIHLGRLEEALNRCSSENLTITGLQGDPSEIIGDIIAVRNTFTLGFTEENIISQIRTFTTKLLVEESSARTHLKETENPQVKDLVSRAYAILIHSYQIDAIEALDAISLLKFGADLGWVKGAKPAVLNELLFNCRRAHLFCHYEESVSQTDLPHLRAEFIHKALKKITLNI